MESPSVDRSNHADENGSSPQTSVDPDRIPWTVDGFLDLLESASDAIVVADSSGMIVFVNAQTERLYGHSRQELVGQAAKPLLDERAYRFHLAKRVTNPADAHLRRLVTARRASQPSHNGDGAGDALEISVNPMTTAGQTLILYAIRDLSARRRSQPEGAYFDAVVASSNDAIIAEDLDGSITSWNPAAERLYGYTEGEMQSNSMTVLVPPGHDDEQPEIRRRVRSGERVGHYETVRARKDGTHIDVSVTTSPVRDRAGRLIGIATIARDITARLHYQDQLRFLADHDPLTGARNRRSFERDVSEQIGRSRRYQEHASLLMIDIDGFKDINDTHGHKAGDSVLKEIAAGLRRRLRNTDTVARIGGDEFAVLLPYAGDDQAIAITEDLRRMVRELRINIGEQVISISVSIGATRIDKDTNGEQILAEADRAMYRDKARDA